MIVLSDQSMPAVLPSVNSLCPAIIRVEGGLLWEIGDAFCNLYSDFALPVGSIILIGSLSHLLLEGLAKYTKRVVNEVKRFSSMFRGGG
jgi:hypothetical protein